MPGIVGGFWVVQRVRSDGEPAATVSGWLPYDEAVAELDRRRRLGETGLVAAACGECGGSDEGCERCRPQGVLA